MDARTCEALVAIVNGQHSTARIGRYAVTALLCSTRPEAWETVERLLLAAQRQEGLRQVVLESVDFAQPEAFVRMLRLIELEKLSRFAAVARAAAVWFGVNADPADTGQIDTLIFETLENLEDPRLREQRLRKANGQSLYLALWASAFQDVVAATSVAERLVDDPDFERRYPAVHLLRQVGTTGATRVLKHCLADRDLRVALKAAEILPAHTLWAATLSDPRGVFEALEDLIERTPEDQQLPPAIWPWNRIQANRAQLARKLIANRGDRPFAELTPYVPAMDADGRRILLKAIEEAVKKRDELRSDERDLALSLLSDPSNAVRQEAFEILAHASVTPEEAADIEPLLSRKASDLRRGVMRLLLRQKTADCRASIERLSQSGDALMVQAAEELRSEVEPKSVPAASLEDGLGLFDPAQRTRPPVLNKRLKLEFLTSATLRSLQSLGALIDQHRETSVAYRNFGGVEIPNLFGNIQWLDPKQEFPLWETWQDWWRSRTSESGESSGMELARALCAVLFAPQGREPAWETTACRQLVPGRADLKFHRLQMQVLWFLVRSLGTPEMLSFLLDALESYLTCVTEHLPPKEQRVGLMWPSSTFALFLQILESCRTALPAIWTHEHWRHYWSLLRWTDESISSDARRYVALEALLEARRRGLASEADLVEQLMRPRGLRGGGLWDLSRVTGRKPAKLFEQYPDLAGIVQRCRERILEIELKRGDLPTGASGAARSLRSVYGAELAVTLLALLGKDLFSRGYMADSESKSVVLSHLLRVCLPKSDDTPEAFAALAEARGIARKRLVEFGVYAPQWADHVERATGIAGFTDAAYWLHAHTKDSQWTVDEEIRELWFAEVSERTPLPRQELLDGAVDIDWCRRVRAALPAKDWKLTLDAAKYASGGGGHKRAELFASAIAGDVDAVELAERVAVKRSQDALRAIGLVPLPEAEPQRRQEILRRYELLQRFLRESRKFGSMRQASEKQAYTIALANLARTAGYPDPMRLSWAMEALAIADLRAGPVEAADGGVRAVLSIDAAGEPQLDYFKDGKPLKSIPASLRKSPTLSALRSRKTELGQQTSRMRQSLEEAMIRGDRFSLRELGELEAHPLLKPMIASLLFACEDGAVRWHDSLDGQPGMFRIAHPVDLLKSNSWPRLQRECIDAARAQPFKQTFRELYVLTGTEREQGTHSGRYEGQQVNPRTATAVIGKRGWVNVPDEGLRKTFHHDDVSAWVTFLEGWSTPAEVDGLTVEHVVFTNKADSKPIPLHQVPERVFSEAMRDIDLMVSVAHRGGVDPEATASTIDMRAALLRETLRLLKIQNVRLAERHAFVDGKLGAYNVQLGSGIVHRQPGGNLCIIPVHSQHRGRIFLPFADDDPKTAEIVSKVVMLAQDDKIKDPTILEQLR
jgi:hypothetical protein